jgi:hypothetical protein
MIAARHAQRCYSIAVCACHKPGPHLLTAPCRAHYELFIRALDAPNVGKEGVCLVHPTVGPTQVRSLAHHFLHVLHCCSCKYTSSPAAHSVALHPAPFKNEIQPAWQASSCAWSRPNAISHAVVIGVVVDVALPV